MGEVARELVALSGPASVHGIIPRALIAHEQPAYDASDPASHIDEKVFGRTTIVSDMHTRKKMMALEVVQGGPGGGFVALSGGFGTFEELMEMTTWNQLNIHSMPVVVYNVDGYWTKLFDWIKEAVPAGFISSGNTSIIVEAKDAKGVIDCLSNYTNALGRLHLTWDEV